MALINMNEDWKALTKTGASLELPAFAGLPDKSLEKQDTLNSTGSLPLLPGTFLQGGQKHGSANTARLDQLRALRTSAGFSLIAGSSLLLKICQMDMDYPPSLRDYVRLALKKLMRDIADKDLNPDVIRVRLSTDTNPEVDTLGRERFSRHLSLTDIALLSLNEGIGPELTLFKFSDDLMDAAAPALTVKAMIHLIVGSTWVDDYRALLEKFWRDHRTTFRAVAKLGFLDNLVRYRARQLISEDGYLLALEALGLKSFPGSPLALLAPVRGSLSTIYMLAVGETVLSGTLQIRSDNTSHCFIHGLDPERPPVEYISEDPRQMLQKMIETLDPGSTPEQVEGPVRLSTVEGDVFTAVTAAQERLSLDFLHQHVGLAAQPDTLRIIKRGMRLFGIVDVWQSQPDILARVPTPQRTANAVMTDLLQRRYNIGHDPDKIFIRYVRGHSLEPLGHARHGGNDFNIPSDKPISLSEALVYNYRVPVATGYIDHGARNVVYLDLAGNGEWAAERELKIKAGVIEGMIREIDFLSLMSRDRVSFWQQNRADVEAALQSHFVHQALVCLKSGSLRRSGFDLISRALEQLTADTQDSPIDWKTPGFALQHSVFEAPKAQYCPSLLILSHPSGPRRVLYQAGTLKAFHEFDNEHELDRYLRQAARDEAWRQAVLSYVPLRHHPRLDYILKVWSGAQAPTEPVSMLRPWTDTLRNHDTRLALANNKDELQVTASPFAYIRQTLEQNNEWDAQDIIVTSQEVTLLNWSRLLNHLQMLLAPMSVLLTPAAVASLVTELGIASLSLALAHLPGARHTEKSQATLDLLTLGLLQLPPVTPRLANALSRVSTPVRVAARSGSGIANHKTFSRWLARATRPRQTTLARFPNTDALLKCWSLPGNPAFSTLPVRVWKLRRQFLLWTAESSQARTLVVSTHGYYLPWSRTVRIPNGTELQVYAPHGHELIDPGLHRVVSRKTQPVAVLTSVDNRPAFTPQHPYLMTDKLMAGTSTPGSIRNYSLSKFQTPDDESYQSISRIVRNSNSSPLMGQVQHGPMDVLTVRNRFGTPHPTLEQLLDALFDNGIHYDRIVLVHCRCAALKSLLGQAPVYTAP
jgi:hypothetical protein